MKEQKKLGLGQAVKDLQLDQHRLLHGRKRLTTQYYGNVALLCHSVMANEHGQRLRFSVLLTKYYANFVIKEAELEDQSPANFIRNLVQEHVKSKAGPDYIFQELADD